MSKLLYLDGQLLLTIQRLTKHKLLDKFFKTYTRLGDAGAMWIILGLVLIAIDSTRDTGLFLMLTLTITWILNTVILKKFLKRTRPFEVVEGVRLLIKSPKDTSFPSGHSSSSMACAMAVLLTAGNVLGMTCLVLALLMCFSRIYVGVHFPFDVIVGAFVGIIITIVLFLIIF